MFDQNRTVSIVVPTYNRKVYLKECLESLLNQTYKNIEIIVSDDGSTDGTVEFMNEMVGRYENIKFVQNRKYPKGPNGNKNNGLDYVNSEVVGILDDDDTLVPNAIEVMIEKMNEGYDVVMTNCIRSDNGEFSGYGLTQNREVDPKEYLCGKTGGEFWSLFKRSLLGKKRFDVDIYGGEGLVWKELLTQAKFFIYIKDYGFIGSILKVSCIKLLKMPKRYCGDTKGTLSIIKINYFGGALAILHVSIQLPLCLPKWVVR